MPWNVDGPLRLLEGLSRRISNATPAMERSRDIAAKAIEENFDAESAAGEAWEPLADATVEDRAAKGFEPGPILDRTGDLRRAATAHQAVGDDFAEVGLEEGHPYGHFHVSSRARTRIPLRDFLAVSEAKRDEIERAIVEYLEDE